MTNRQIATHITELRKYRQGWMNILSKNGDSISAAEQIVAINHKIELLKALWNFSDDTAEFPFP